MQATRTIARKSKQLRRQHNMTRADLARKSGVSSHTIRRIETEESSNRGPHLATLNALARGFRIQLSELLASPIRGAAVQNQ